MEKLLKEVSLTLPDHKDIKVMARKTHRTLGSLVVEKRGKDQDRYYRSLLAKMLLLSHLIIAVNPHLIFNQDIDEEAQLED